MQQGAFLSFNALCLISYCLTAAMVALLVFSTGFLIVSLSKVLAIVGHPILSAIWSNWSMLAANPFRSPSASRSLTTLDTRTPGIMWLTLFKVRTSISSVFVIIREDPASPAPHSSQTIAIGSSPSYVPAWVLRLFISVTSLCSTLQNIAMRLSSFYRGGTVDMAHFFRAVAYAFTIWECLPSMASVCAPGMIIPDYANYLAGLITFAISLTSIPSHENSTAVVSGLHLQQAADISFEDEQTLIQLPSPKKKWILIFDDEPMTPRCNRPNPFSENFTPQPTFLRDSLSSEDGAETPRNQLLENPSGPFVSDSHDTADVGFAHSSPPAIVDEENKTRPDAFKNPSRSTAFSPIVDICGTSSLTGKLANCANRLVSNGIRASNVKGKPEPSPLDKAAVTGHGKFNRSHKAAEISAGIECAPNALAVTSAEDVLRNTKHSHRARKSKTFDNPTAPEAVVGYKWPDIPGLRTVGCSVYPYPPVFSEESMKSAEVPGRLQGSDSKRNFQPEQDLEQVDRVIEEHEELHDELLQLGEKIKATMRALQSGQAPVTPPRTPMLRLTEPTPPQGPIPTPPPSTFNLPRFLDSVPSPSLKLVRKSVDSLAGPNSKTSQPALAPGFLEDDDDTAKEWQLIQTMIDFFSGRVAAGKTTAPEQYEDTDYMSTKSDDGEDDRSLGDFSLEEEVCIPGPRYMQSLGLQYAVGPESDFDTIEPTFLKRADREIEHYPFPLSSLYGPREPLPKYTWSPPPFPPPTEPLPPLPPLKNAHSKGKPVWSPPPCPPPTDPLPPLPPPKSKAKLVRSLHSLPSPTAPILPFPSSKLVAAAPRLADARPEPILSKSLHVATSKPVAVDRVLRTKAHSKLDSKRSPSISAKTPTSSPALLKPPLGRSSLASGSDIITSSLTGQAQVTVAKAKALLERPLPASGVHVNANAALKRVSLVRPKPVSIAIPSAQTQGKAVTRRPLSIPRPPDAVTTKHQAVHNQSSLANHNTKTPTISSLKAQTQTRVSTKPSSASRTPLASLTNALRSSSRLLASKHTTSHSVENRHSPASIATSKVVPRASSRPHASRGSAFR